MQGINRFFKGEQEVTFIGTLTCFHDTKYETISPMVREDVPDSVINVVDGQQRLTTLMICSILLHKYMSVNVKKSKSARLKDRIVPERLGELLKTFEADRGIGEVPYYPKMIRAFDDQWSVDPSKIKYVSPLSSLIRSYGEHTRGNAEKKFNTKITKTPQDFPDELIKAQQNFNDLVACADKHIDAICKGSSIGDETVFSMPAIKDCMGKNPVLLSIFKLDTLPTDINLEDETELKLIRALFLSAYLLKHVHFIALITSMEDQVFEIFESLNTTGQVLTAIETFKPEILVYEGNKDYVTSKSREYYDEIEKYINSLKSADKQQKTANEIVTNFALAETGTPLSRHLGVQRDYLRNRSGFKEIKKTGKHEVYDFLKQLLSVSQVSQRFWQEEGNLQALAPYASVGITSDEFECICLCLKYLKKANHIISRSLISRFHYEVMSARPDDAPEQIKQLFDVIKATTAFFAIWRSTRPSTDRIDDWHRIILQGGVVKTSDERRIEFEPANRQAKKQITSQRIKKVFLQVLRENPKGSQLKISSVEEYKENLYNVPIYRTQKATAKFLLLVAAHNAAPSKKIPGGLEEMRSGFKPTLSGKIWNDENCASIDHLIPQDWAGIDALKLQMVHRLGNLTLLSSKANSILGKMDWEKRRLFFKMLGAPTETKIDQIHAENNLVFNEAHVKYIKSLSLNVPSLIVPLTNFEEFGENSIRPRSDNLAEKIWKILYEEWLAKGM